MFLVINCPSCGKILLANVTNKSRTCPNCGVKIFINEAKIIAKTKTSKRALKLIQSLKYKENEDTHKVTYKRFKA